MARVSKVPVEGLTFWLESIDSSGRPHIVAKVSKIPLEGLTF